MNRNRSRTSLIWTTKMICCGAVTCRTDLLSFGATARNVTDTCPIIISTHFINSKQRIQQRDKLFLNLLQVATTLESDKLPLMHVVGSSFYQVKLQPLCEKHMWLSHERLQTMSEKTLTLEILIIYFFE